MMCLIKKGIVLLVLFVLLIVLGIGIVLGLIGCTVVAGMWAVGVLTLSTLIGLLTKRYTAAAQALVLQVGGAAGVVCGIAAAGVLLLLIDVPGGAWVAVGFGAVGGLIAGLVQAALFNLACGIALSRLRKKVSHQLAPHTITS